MKTDRAYHVTHNPWPYKFSLGRRLSGLRDPRHLMAVLLKRTGLAPLFTMVTNDDVKLRFFPSSVSTEIWEKKDRSGPDREFLKRYLKPGDVYVDIGANIGYLTIVAARMVTASGRAIAFEANPRVFHFLEHNVALNNLTNVTTNHLAAGAEEGFVDVLECPGDDSQSCVAHGVGATPVPMVRLDKMLKHEQKIALLKIDVEGYEKFVIEGARGLLNRVEAIYFEYYARNYSRYGYCGATLVDALQQEGFQIYRLREGACSLVRTDESSTDCENFIAVRDVQDFSSRTGYIFRV